MKLNENLFEDYMPKEVTYEEVSDALREFLWDIDYPADVASQFSEFEDTAKSLKALLDRVVRYYKNE